MRPSGDRRWLVGAAAADGDGSAGFVVRGCDGAAGRRAGSGRRGGSGAAACSATPDEGAAATGSKTVTTGTATGTVDAMGSATARAFGDESISGPSFATREVRENHVADA